MARPRPIARHVAAASWIVLTVLLFAACGGTEPGVSIVGTYRATTFVVETPGRPDLDVLAAGGSVNLTIAPDNTTSGTLLIPANIGLGTSPITASLAGKAVMVGQTVVFSQGVDTFVSALPWTINTSPSPSRVESISVSDQPLGTATVSITLTRL
jgi:hypothetical protein